MRERNCLHANIARAIGMVQHTAYTYGEDIPKEIEVSADGWSMRRQIKKWAEENGFTHFRIIRNTSYVQDLRGPVYELWVWPCQIQSSMENR